MASGMTTVNCLCSSSRKQTVYYPECAPVPPWAVLSRLLLFYSITNSLPTTLCQCVQVNPVFPETAPFSFLWLDYHLTRESCLAAQSGLCAFFPQ